MTPLSLLDEVVPPCVFLEAAVDLYDACKGSATLTLRGRQRSGFVGGYHEASYLLGRMEMAASLEGIPAEAVPLLREVEQAAMADAQADMVELVRMEGIAVFAPPTRRGSAHAGGEH